MRRLLLLLLLITMMIPASQAQRDVTVPTDLEVEVHRQINDVRADKEMHNQNLQPLKLHSVLISVARSHSEDMIERGYFAHENPDGEGPADRVNDAGVQWSRVGENLAQLPGVSKDNVAQVAVDGWVESPGHYANIITDYAFTGIGIAISEGTYFITQVFVNADPNHLEDIGRIYDNNELDNITTENEEGRSFRITTDMLIIGVVVFFVLLGIDAGRRNRRYYGRR